MRTLFLMLMLSIASQSGAAVVGDFTELVGTNNGSCGEDGTASSIQVFYPFEFETDDGGGFDRFGLIIRDANGNVLRGSQTGGSVSGVGQISFLLLGITARPVTIEWYEMDALFLVADFFNPTPEELETLSSGELLNTFVIDPAGVDGLEEVCGSVPSIVVPSMDGAHGVALAICLLALIGLAGLRRTAR